MPTKLPWLRRTASSMIKLDSWRIFWPVIWNQWNWGSWATCRGSIECNRTAVHAWSSPICWRPSLLPVPIGCDPAAGDSKRRQAKTQHSLEASLSQQEGSWYKSLSIARCERWIYFNWQRDEPVGNNRDSTRRGARRENNGPFWLKLSRELGQYHYDRKQNSKFERQNTSFS